MKAVFARTKHPNPIQLVQASAWCEAPMKVAAPLHYI